MVRKLWLNVSCGSHNGTDQSCCCRGSKKYFLYLIFSWVTSRRASPPPPCWTHAPARAFQTIQCATRSSKRHARCAHHRMGSFGADVDPVLFIALSCANVNTGLQATTRAAIEVLGGQDGLAIAEFASKFIILVRCAYRPAVYTFLAGLDAEASTEQTQAIVSAARALAESHAGRLSAANFDSLQTSA